VFLVSGSKALSGSVDSFFVGDFFKSFDSNLTIVRKGQKQFQIFLESVRLLFSKDWKCCLILENLLEEIMIGHVGGFFEGLACWNE
jgi:hypothetical protein